MRTLPLYPSPPYTALELATPEARDVNPTCTQCGLFEKVRSPCMPAEGDPGGLLVVGEGPWMEDDRQGVPFVGPTGALVRQMVGRHWSGPVVYAHAVRCFPGARVVSDKSVDACRPYLAKTFLETAPKRVLVFGTDALKSVVGRSFHQMSARRGYAYLPSANVPAFMLMPPDMAFRNRYIRSWLEQDLEWALTCPDPARPPTGGLVQYVQTPQDSEDACFDLEAGGECSFDTETFGAIHDREFKIVTLSICNVGSPDAFVWDEQALKDPAIRAPVKRLLESPRVQKGGQNVKYDKLVVRAGMGAVVKQISFDARLMKKLLMADSHTGLEVMQTRVGMGGGKDEAGEYVAGAVKNIRNAVWNLTDHFTAKTKKLQAKRDVEPFGLDPSVEALMLKRVQAGVEPKRYAFAFMPEGVRGVYCARDAISTGLLSKEFGAELAMHPELEELWRNVVIPLEHAITNIEWNGIKVDRQALAQLQSAMAAKESDLRARLAPYVWTDFNPNASSGDTGKLLFGDPAEGCLGLKPTRMTPSGKPGTAADDIEKIKHPVVPIIMELRKVLHFKAQYADGIEWHLRDDGRVHTSYKIDGTETGRPSTEEPNLLNIPRISDDKGNMDGKMCRDLFVSDDGFTLVEGDYNQIELRIAAMLSEDEVMTDVFKSGRDFHLETAKMIAPIFGVDPAEVTKEHPLRSRAKIVNFGVLYGKEAAGLAIELGIKKQEAQTLVDAILGKFRKLARWIKDSLDFARRTGYCRTWWNGKDARIRPLWKIGGHNEDERQTAERGSWNTRIQGTATEFTNASLGAIQQWIDEEGLNRDVRLVLTVYDSIIAEVRDAYVDEYIFNANRIMTGWPSGAMPIKADFKKGRAWGSLENVHV